MLVSCHLTGPQAAHASRGAAAAQRPLSALLPYTDDRSSKAELFICQQTVLWAGLNSS